MSAAGLRQVGSAVPGNNLLDRGAALQVIRQPSVIEPVGSAFSGNKMSVVGLSEIIHAKAKERGMIETPACAPPGGQKELYLVDMQAKVTRLG